MRVGFIYKITNPRKAVYIGQTVDFKKRFRHYKSLQCKSQQKLYNSLKKYGFDKHKFEIIHECDEIDLNKSERYYQELFNCLSKSGLNLCLVAAEGRIYVRSEETKAKMAAINRLSAENHRKNGTSFFSKETQEKALQSRLANPRVLSKEAKENLVRKNTGKIKDEATRLKISLAKKGVKTGKRKAPRSEFHSLNHSKAILGKFKGEDSKNANIILNMETGIYYFGGREATDSQSKFKNYSHVNSMLSGIRNNYTSLKRV